MRGALPVSAKSHALCGEQPEQVSATDAGGHNIRRQLELGMAMGLCAHGKAGEIKCKKTGPLTIHTTLLLATESRGIRTATDSTPPINA